MSRRRAEITQATIKRAVCATIAAGVKVYGVRVDGAAVTVLTEPMAQPAEAPNGLVTADEIDAMLGGNNGQR